MGVIRTRFSGRDRLHAKRLALQFWAENQQTLGISLKEFCEQCIALGNGTTILFCPTIRSQPEASRA